PNLHFDGTTWSQVTIPVGSSLWGTSSSNIYVAGPWSGYIYRWDGSSWATVRDPTSPPNTSFNSIWGSSATDIWAVGDYGVAMHSTGGAWSSVSGLSSDLYRVSGTSSSDVWVAGDMAVDHWNGTMWDNNYEVLSGVSMRGLCANSASDVWAAGSYGTTTHWD